MVDRVENCHPVHGLKLHTNKERIWQCGGDGTRRREEHEFEMAGFELDGTPSLQWSHGFAAGES